MPAKRVNWIAVRTAYVVRGWSAQQCAEEFHVDRTTISKRASAEGWLNERHKLLHNATAAATEELTATAKTAVNAIREEHATLVARMHSVLDGIDDDIAAAKPGRNRIETRKLAAEAFQMVLRSSRLVLGITDGQSSVMAGQDTGDRKIIFEEEPPAVEPAAESA